MMRDYRNKREMNDKFMSKHVRHMERSASKKKILQCWDRLFIVSQSG